MDLGLDGRTVIVTGASGGIGREIARGYAAEGAHVLLTYHRSKEGAEVIAKEIGDRAKIVRFDLSDPAGPGDLTRLALDWTGRIDVLINNAVSWGGDGPRDGPFEEAPEAAWLDLLRTNVEGALRLTRAVAPTFRQRGWGRVVHISSSIATDGMAGGEDYGAAKAALHGFSRSAAFGLGKDGDILSNVVMPGFTRTATNTEMVERFGSRFSALSPLGRLLDATEIARAVVYLGSAANTGITGQAIAVTGGA